MQLYEKLPEILLGLLNVPDLILLAIIFVSAAMGAKRGLVRTLCNFLGRIVALVCASMAARLLSPVLARYLVTPIVGDIFEIRASDLLSRAPNAAEALQSTATDMAASMAQGLAFFLLFFIFLFVMNMLVHTISTALKLVTRIAPIGFLDHFFTQYVWRTGLAESEPCVPNHIDRFFARPIADVISSFGRLPCHFCVQASRICPSPLKQEERIIYEYANVFPLWEKCRSGIYYKN